MSHPMRQSAVHTWRPGSDAIVGAGHSVKVGGSRPDCRNVIPEPTGYQQAAEVKRVNMDQHQQTPHSSWGSLWGPAALDACTDQITDKCSFHPVMKTLITFAATGALAAISVMRPVMVEQGGSVRPLFRVVIILFHVAFHHDG